MFPRYTIRPRPASIVSSSRAEITNNNILLGQALVCGHELVTYLKVGPPKYCNFFLNPCHYFVNYLQVFATPNFCRETEKLKVGPTSRDPPIV